jgi:RNAse (barnase) inhibitor barstar
MGALGLASPPEQPCGAYYRTAVLDEDLAWLRRQGYTMDEFDCTKWHAEADFHTEVAVRLAFPDYYGRNLDAFNDCVGEIEVPDSGGRAIVLRRYDLFTQREPRVAQHILDILASASWHCLLFGRRLLTLAQSDDPRILFEPIGAHPALRRWFRVMRIFIWTVGWLVWFMGGLFSFGHALS